MAEDDLKGLRIALYARYSTEMQSAGSIEDQLRVCRREVERRGGVVDEALVFADAAVSGAGMDREGMMRLMHVVETKPKRVDVVVIEDISRLGREQALLHGARRIFEYEGVRLIAVADGIDTLDRSAALGFSLRALMSEMYRVDLRQKTKRGLEGRALRGLSTGGLPYGYGTQPADGGGSAIVIRDEHADVVRRIFRHYLEGNSLALIAGRLNADGVPSPRAHTKSKYKGWVATTIRAVLHNEAYVGVWTYGKRAWLKAPGTNRRRGRPGDPTGIIRQDRQDLRIVDDATWTAVKERLAAVRAHYVGSGVQTGIAGRKTQYLFSGLLFCAACGSPMIIAGGSTTMFYRCSAAVKRKTCGNNLSVKEPVARASLLAELRYKLASDEGVRHARRRIVERLAEVEREKNATLRVQERRVHDLQTQVDKLVDTVVAGVRSDAIKKRLAETEQLLAVAVTEFERTRSMPSSPVKLPSPEDILKLVYQLDERLTRDVTCGRELLRRVFKDGRIDLIPQPDGFYIARSEVLPLVLLTKTPSEESSEGVRFPAISCAGRI